MTVYKVKSGDTLSKIAKKNNIGINAISGYRSGDTNKIYPGESLSFTSGTPKATSYAGNIKTALNSDITSTDTSHKQPKTLQGAFDTQNQTTIRDTAEANRVKAFNKLQNYRTDQFNTEKKRLGLDSQQQTISNIDANIANVKAKRDAIINGMNKKGVSEVTYSGREGNIFNKFNRELQNMIDQRNGLATDYNNKVGNIERDVQRGAQDINTQLGFYTQEKNGAQNRLDAYTNALVSEIGGNKAFDRSKSLIGYKAQVASQYPSASGTKYKPILNPYTGQPMGIFNPISGTFTMNNGQGINTGAQQSTADSVGSIVQSLRASNPNASIEELKNIADKNNNLTPIQRAQIYQRLNATQPSGNFLSRWFGNGK